MGKPLDETFSRTLSSLTFLLRISNAPQTRWPNSICGAAKFLTVAFAGNYRPGPRQLPGQDLLFWHSSLERWASEKKLKKMVAFDFLLL
jgi:hypothetical protein